jgi:hypothetical protein
MVAADEAADDDKDKRGMREAASVALGVWKAPDVSQSAGLLIGGTRGGE